MGDEKMKLKKARVSRTVRELSPNKAVAAQIARALEIMERSRRAEIVKPAKPAESFTGNQYIIPAPLILQWTLT
jgi:hypothetical protein